MKFVQAANSKVLLADASSPIEAAEAEVTTDRVIDLEYDADGRLQRRTTYNNKAADPLETVTTYDELGRMDRVTDAWGSYTDEKYGDTGRLIERDIFDGAGLRSFAFEYDGHDRIKRQTALGPPDLITLFAYDGLDRRTLVTSPKGIQAKTEFDPAGRQIRDRSFISPNETRAATLAPKEGRAPERGRRIEYPGEHATAPEPANQPT